MTFHKQQQRPFFFSHAVQLCFFRLVSHMIFFYWFNIEWVIVQWSGERFFACWHHGVNRVPFEFQFLRRKCTRVHTDLLCFCLSEKKGFRTHTRPLHARPVEQSREKNACQCFWMNILFYASACVIVLLQTGSKGQFHWRDAPCEWKCSFFKKTIYKQTNRWATWQQ